MELMLLIMAAAYAVGSKNTKDTNTAAYKAGKEPPGLSKARLRHEAGGGRFVTRPGKNSSKSKPKGPGATRLLLASRWANGCEKARIRGEDKLRRWHAWYQEQAPHRDEQWREKQRQKMANRADRLSRWQGRWNSAKNAAGAAAATMTGRNSGEQNTTGDATDQANVEPSAATDRPAEPAAGEDTPNHPEPETPTQSTEGEDNQSDPASDPEQGSQTETADENTQNAEKDEETGENTGSSDDTSQTEKPGQSEEDTGSSDSGAGSGTATQSSTAPIGELVDYQQGAATLHNHADEVAGYDTALTGLGQDMESVNWGAEVHGELTEMHSKLGDIAARYRDLAESVKHQGDAVNDAYDAAPWAPDRSVLTQ